MYRLLITNFLEVRPEAEIILYMSTNCEPVQFSYLHNRLIKYS